MGEGGGSGRGSRPGGQRLDRRRRELWESRGGGRGGWGGGGGESPAPQVLRVFCVLTKHLQKIEKERRV